MKDPVSSISGVFLVEESYPSVSGTWRSSIGDSSGLEEKATHKRIVRMQPVDVRHTDTFSAVGEHRVSILYVPSIEIGVVESNSCTQSRAVIAAVLVAVAWW